MRKRLAMLIVGLSAFLGLLAESQVNSQAASTQGKVAVYYRYYDTDKRPKHLSVESKDTLYGAVGTAYQTQPEDLLDGGFGWVLRRQSANVTGTFTEKTIKVYYDYQTQDGEDYDHHGDAVDTELCWTADHQFLIMAENYRNEAYTSIERRNFHRKAYQVIFITAANHQAKRTYNFGGKYVWQKDQEKFQVQLSGQGDIVLKQSWKNKRGKYHTETVKVSHTGKYQSYKYK